MVSRLIGASPTAAGAVVGVPAGIAVALFAWALGSGWIAASLAGVVAAALMGVLMGRIVGAHQGTVRRAAGDLPSAILVAADRAARGGPVPTDPEVRAAAARIAEEQLELTRRGAPLLLVLFPPLVVPILLSATNDQPGPALFTAVPALLAAVSALLLSLHMVTTPRRLRKRLQLLAGS